MQSYRADGEPPIERNEFAAPGVCIRLQLTRVTFHGLPQVPGAGPISPGSASRNLLNPLCLSPHSLSWDRTTARDLAIGADFAR